MAKQGLEPAHSSEVRGKQKEKWTIKDRFPNDYLKDSDFSDLEKQFLFTRGIQDLKQAEGFLSPDYSALHDPFLMKGMKEAVVRIKQAVEHEEKVSVYGDYDVDGITATAIIYEVLNDLGIDTDYYIPKRDTEGYGLNNEALDEIAKKGSKLVITVDCGVTAVDEVEYAKKLGLDIIITDHHSIREEKGKEVLPETIIINPKQKSDKYPYKELSGAGVAFKLAQVLYKEFPDKLISGQEKWLLDLVALGTVCDVVPLTDENRILTHFGIKVLQKTKRLGIQSLTEISGTLLNEINSHKIGYQLGPRLNAAGRMETAETSIKLLLTKDKNEARMLALELNKLNMERQELTGRILKEAIEEIEGRDGDAKIYLVAKKNWPAGVVGIIASKLTDKYARPTIVFEDKGDTCHGSARSPKCFNIIKALESASEYLIRYGGHARAAGLTVKKEHFVLLENKLIEISDKQIKEEDLLPEYKIDSTIDLKEINEKTYSLIKKLEPFGLGNPSPVLVSNDIAVDSFKKVGQNQEHLKLTFTNGKEKINGIFFSYVKDNSDLKNKIDAVFAMSENEWGGRVSYEMRCIALRESS